jgi:hypothetical protein
MQRLELVHTVGEEATRKISEWMHQPEVTDWTEQACLKQLYHTLQRMGFTGSQEYLVTEDGLFFPQYPLLTHSEVTVLVPVALGWTLGAPGLVQVEANGVLSYIPGVFAGKVYKSKASAVLLRNSVTGPG